MKNSGHGSKCSNVIVSRLNESVSLVSLLVQHVDLRVLIRNRLDFETYTRDVTFFMYACCKNMSTHGGTEWAFNLRKKLRWSCFYLTRAVSPVWRTDHLSRFKPYESSDVSNWK